MKGACTIDGCERPIHARGWCVGHYSRWRKRKDLRVDQPIKREPIPLIDRLFARRIITPGPMSSPCWLVSLASGPDGYVNARITGRTSPEVRVHRYAYEVLVGIIPDGLHLDHLCRNRGCWNPDHLEPVTPRVNMLRSSHRSAIAFRTGLCINGHSLDDAYVFSGRRQCRSCCVERSRRRKEARRGGLPEVSA